MFDHIVIDADCAGGQPGQAKRIQNFLARRLLGFRAQTADTASGVIARQGRKINHRDRTGQPGGLMVFLYASTTGQRLGAALNRRGIGLNRRNPIQIQVHPFVAWMGGLGQLGRCSFRIDHVSLLHFGAPVIEGVYVPCYARWYKSFQAIAERLEGNETKGTLE